MDFGRGHGLGDDGPDAGVAIFREVYVCCGGYATVAFEKVASRYATISGWGLSGRETT